jgi:hypothetical protein
MPTFTGFVCRLSHDFRSLCRLEVNEKEGVQSLGLYNIRYLAGSQVVGRAMEGMDAGASQPV